MSKTSSLGGAVVRFATPLLIIAAGAGAFLILGKKHTDPRPPEKDKPLPVKAVTVELQDGGLFYPSKPLDLRSSGSVVPYRELKIAAEVKGRVLRKTDQFRIGNHVEKGATLVEIDRQDYQIERNRLGGQLEQAKQDLEVLKKQIARLIPIVENGRAQAKARESLYKIEEQLFAANRASSEQAVIESRLSWLVARKALLQDESQLDVDQGRQKRLEAVIDETDEKIKAADRDLERCTVRAPSSGVIVEENVELGDAITETTLVARMHNVSKAEVLCYLKPSQLTWLWESLYVDNKVLGTFYGAALTYGRERFRSSMEFPKGKNQINARVVVKQNGDYYAWRGRLDRLSGSGFEESTRTVPCRIVVDHPESVDPITEKERQVYRSGQKEVLSDNKTEINARKEQLKRRAPRMLMTGMFVDSVFISINPKTPLLRLPEIAVRPGEIVLKIVKGEKGKPDRLKIVNVRRVQTEHSQHVLIDGTGVDLRPGDRVITSPMEYPQNGTLVTEKARAQEKPGK